MSDYEEEVNLDLSNEEEQDNGEFIEDSSEEEKDPRITDSEGEDYISDIFEPVKPKPKVKRVLTEEHKAKLQAGRIRALENRRANARKNKEMKTLAKQKKDLEYENLKHEVDELQYKPKSRSIKYNTQENPSMNGFAETYNLSHEQLEELQENAISNYEKKRKDKKAVKHKEERDKELLNAVLHAHTDTSNAWTMYCPQ